MNKLGDEVKSWKNFIYNGNTYDLSHLTYHILTFQENISGKVYRIHVTYSFHCFAKNDDKIDMNSIKSIELMYHAPRESRHFNFKRYELSFKIKESLELLEERPRCYHGGYGKFLTITTEDNEKYIICFDIFRENKKLRLHVKSAYPENSEGHPPLNEKKLDKTNIFSILKNALFNKKTKVQK